MVTGQSRGRLADNHDSQVFLEAQLATVDQEAVGMVGENQLVLATPLLQLQQSELQPQQASSTRPVKQRATQITQYGELNPEQTCAVEKMLVPANGRNSRGGPKSASHNAAEPEEEPISPSSPKRIRSRRSAPSRGLVMPARSAKKASKSESSDDCLKTACSLNGAKLGQQSATANDDNGNVPLETDGVVKAWPRICLSQLEPPTAPDITRRRPLELTALRDDGADRKSEIDSKSSATCSPPDSQKESPSSSVSPERRLLASGLRYRNRTYSTESCLADAITNQKSLPTAGAGLRNRRKLTLTLDPPKLEDVDECSPDEGSRRGSKKYSSGGCASPESKQSPVVQLMFMNDDGSGPVVTMPSRSRMGTKILSCTVLPEDDNEDETTHGGGMFSPRLRPLPAAFANRRSLIIFDWDDTLCPTTWIRSLLKGTIADMEAWMHADRQREKQVDWYQDVPKWFNHPLPDQPNLLEGIEEVQSAVIHLINVAQAFGVVCIVTNAVPGWVDKTIKKWLPQLWPYIKGHGARPPIKVLYGQQAFKRVESLEGLSWIDELGEYMWWKKAAMSLAIENVEELYRLDEGASGGTMMSSPSGGALISPGSPASGGASISPSKNSLMSSDMMAAAFAGTQSLSWTSGASSKRLVNLISFGDNEAEMQAAAIARCQMMDVRGKVRQATMRYDLDKDSATRSGSKDTFDDGIDSNQCQAASQETHPIRRHVSASKVSDKAAASERNESSHFAWPTSRERISPRRRRIEAKRLVGTSASVPPRSTARHVHGKQQPWVKLVKLADMPHVKVVVQQLKDMADMLPQIISARKDLRVNLDEQQQDYNATATAASDLHSFALTGMQSPMAYGENEQVWESEVNRLAPEQEQSLERGLMIQTV